MRSLRAPKSRGITLIEVLFVLAMIAILLMMVIPRMPDERQPHHSVQCMSNTKQLALGWFLYTQDYDGALMPNTPYAGTSGLPTNNWVQGLMDWSTNSQNTDKNLLLAGRMSDYVKSVDIYHCPNDTSESAAGPRVRSYSMNAFMDGGSNTSAIKGWTQMRKMSDVKEPANTFVIIDEHPNSLDDGSYFNDPNNTNTWIDLAGSAHNGAVGLSFADGHSEIHKGLDGSTKQLVVQGGPRPSVIVPPKQGRDLAWVLERTTSPDTNSVAAQ